MQRNTAKTREIKILNIFKGKMKARQEERRERVERTSRKQTKQTNKQKITPNPAYQSFHKMCRWYICQNRTDSITGHRNVVMRYKRPKSFVGDASNQ